MLPVIEEMMGAGTPAGLVPPVLHAIIPSDELSAKIESLPALTFPPTITSPRACERTGVPETAGRATWRIHFTRVTFTLETVTGAATLPTASVAFTVTETVPVPSVADVNVAVAKFAGNVNVLLVALNVTVQAAVLPAMEQVEPVVLAPLPKSFGAVEVSLTVNTILYVPSPARQKCEPSWPQYIVPSVVPPLQSANTTG